MSINSKRGFSLPELLITLAVGLILAGTGILLASTATNQIRLSTSGTNYANLLQNARVRAVRTTSTTPCVWIAAPQARPPLAAGPFQPEPSSTSMETAPIPLVNP